MSDTTDFKVVDVPGLLGVCVTTVDELGRELRDEEWNRETAETQYVYAEFLGEKGLLKGNIPVHRTPNLEIYWSQLTQMGQAFTKAAMQRWLASVDRAGTNEASKRQKLEKRWQKFSHGQ